MTVYLNKKIKDNGMLTDKEALFDEVQALYKQAWQGRHILPTHVKKYVGSIHATPWNTYHCMITDKRLEKPIHRNFTAYDEAFAFLKDINKQNKWTPKNVVTDYGIYMKVNLTQGQRMTFDQRNLKLIQQHTMYAAQEKKTRSFYAATSGLQSKRGTTRIHNLIIGAKPDDTTTDHCNSLRTLDNREFNLRPASRVTQGINQRIASDNKTGITGVHYLKTRDCYIVSRCGKRSAKQFGVTSNGGHKKAKKRAIRYRKKIERTDLRYIEAQRTAKKGIDMDEDDVYNTADDLSYNYESILF